MSRLIILSIFPLLFFTQCAVAQFTDTGTVTIENTTSSLNPEKIYNVKPWLDIPLSAAGTAWTLYGFSVIYRRDTVPFSELLALDRNKINRFDRGATRNFSSGARSAGDIFFYGSMPLPVILLLDKKIRRDALKIGLLYLEAMAITGTAYTVSAMSANRFRPYAYNSEVPLSKRSRGGARNSFFGGHVALVGTSTFFIAKVFSDYHSSMKNKWILYTIAGAATATTGILRVKAGEHFPSDVIVGTIVGPAIGILVPHFHKNKAINRRLSVYPQFGQTAAGFTAIYRLK